MTAIEISKVVTTKMIFPIINGRKTEAGLQGLGFAGTGFFISPHGLALTAAHVMRPNNDGSGKWVSRPETNPGFVSPVEWVVPLPNSDIAVVRVGLDEEAPCFDVHFRDLLLGEDIQATGLAECDMETGADGVRYMLQRCARGYISYGRDSWGAASFPLPAGMSGSPALSYGNGVDQVVGVFVGQKRGEVIEDLLEEVTEAANGNQITRVERISRVEYFARVDVLAKHKNFRAPQFGTLTLAELINAEGGSVWPRT